MNATDLRSVLADPEHSGAYFIDARDTQAMADAGEALGYAVIRVDLDGCQDKADLMKRIATAGRFPDWFGDNWDALADALGDLSWLPAEGHLALIENASAWRTAHPQEFDTLLDILNEAAFHWAEQDIPFWALLPFPGDQLEVLED
jgi:RNAse (barnase) inhibitor barstar